MCKQIPGINDKVLDYIVNLNKTRYYKVLSENPDQHVLSQNVMLICCYVKIAKSELDSTY